MRNTQHTLFSLFTAILILFKNRSHMNRNRFLYQTGKDYSYSKPTESKFIKIKIEIEFELLGKSTVGKVNS